MPAKKAKKRTTAQAPADRAEARSAASKARQAQGSAAKNGGDAPAKQAAKPKDVKRMPGDGIIKSTAHAMGEARKKKGAIDTALKDDIVEGKKKGIHAGALKRVEAMLAKARGGKNDRGATAVATELAHFEHYCEVLGLNDYLAKQGLMFGRAETGEAVAAEPGPRGEGDEKDLRPDSLRHPVAQTPAPAGMPEHAREAASNFGKPAPDLH